MKRYRSPTTVQEHLRFQAIGKLSHIQTEHDAIELASRDTFRLQGYLGYHGQPGSAISDQFSFLPHRLS